MRHQNLLKHYLYRFEMFKLHGMFEQADLELAKIFYLSKDNFKEKLFDISQFLNCHIKFVGQEQAIKDLQRGLNILNKNHRNSSIPAKNILKQDGVFFVKTFDCLCNACKNYSVNVIKKYIKKGILNNIVFDTKNRENIDTRLLYEGVLANLGGFLNG